MAGDNNLSEDMVTGLIGMKENLTDVDNVAVLAYYDTGVISFPTVFIDFTQQEKEKRYVPFKAQNFNGFTKPIFITSKDDERNSI
jgi:uncharacterized protein (DUF2235 family)